MSDNFIKAALVTGGSGGIGQAVAKRMAGDGFAVAVHYSGRADDARRVVDEINGQGGRAVAIQADVADAVQVELLFQESIRAFGRLDVVVNTAGIMTLSPIAKLDLELFDKVIATNLRGTFLVLGQAAQRLSPGGRIIAFSTSVIAKSFPGYGPYIAAKAGVEGLVRVLANEMRGRGITVKAPANVIWDNLVKATEWPKWYSNSSDMQIAGGAKTELEADVEFSWKTFGFPIKSTVHEFVPNERLGWFGSGTGIKAYHTWLIVPKDDGCEVITEETQVGPSAIQYNIEQPTAMYDGHHWWLTALKYRSEHATKN